MPVPKNIANIRAQSQQLISDLQNIAKEAGNAAYKLRDMAPVFEKLSHLNLGNMESVISVLAEFNKISLTMTKGMQDQTDVVQGLQQQLLQLAKAYVKINAERGVGSTKGRRTQAEQRLAEYTPGFLKPAEQVFEERRELRRKLNLIKDQANDAQKVLAETDKTWATVLSEAERVWEKQNRVWYGFAMANRGIWGEKITVQPPKAKTPEELTAITGKGSKEKPTDAWEKFDIMNAQRTFAGLGLGDVAIGNLVKQLDAYGVKVGDVKKPVTELSSGITTLQMRTEGAGGAMQTFTAHIDRSGNVLDDTQKRYRTFGSAVVRDTVEVLKWTIAVSAIYGPIRKMGQMLDEAKKVQMDLVDVQIVLGNTTNDLGNAFEAAARIATQTSSSIEGVIAGYSQAASASASARTEADRMLTTESLLKDSMILSKLASVDQKQALDTLVGAISQLGMNLSQGTQLLDSWVAVSKKANVSVKDMATSFAIVGSAAQEAGLSYNELNALVGTLAQNTTLSADELGNSIRGIIAAMQTDKAQAEFAKYGIATKTVSGDFRDLMDILRQLKVMQQTGILDEKAMGALMQAGGAGARRGAQLSAIVKNLPQAMDLITVSEQANGDAAQAMALEMSTLDAATTRLNNAFTSLAVTLGGEGGILGFLTSVTNGFSGVLTIVRTLVGVLKGAAPVFGILAFANAAIGTKQGTALLGRELPPFLQNLFTMPGLGGVTTGGAAISGIPVANQRSPLTNALARIFQYTNIGVSQTNLGRATGRMQPGVLSPIERVMPVSPYYRPATIGEFGGRILSGVQRPLFPNAGIFSKMNIMSMLGPAAIAMSNIGQPGGGQRALAGGIGALPGILKGSPIWSTIGSIIATGFYDKFLTFKEDLATEWTRTAAEFRAANAPPTGSLEEISSVAVQSMSASEKFWINLQSTVVNAGKGLASFMPGFMKNTYFGGWSGQGPNVGQSESALGIALAGGKNLLGIQVMDKDTAQAIVDAYNAWLVDEANKGLVTGVEIPQTPIESAVTSQIQGLAEFAATASADMMQKALEDIANNVSGAIGNYATAMQAAKSLASTAGNLVTAQQGAINPETGEQIIAPIGGPQMTPEEAVKFISGLSDEQTQMLTASLTEYLGGLESLRTLKEQIAKEPGGIATEEETKQLEALNAQIEIAKTNLPGYVAAFQQANLAAQAAEKVKPVIEVPEGLTAEQRGEIVAKAEEMWKEYLKLSGLTDEEINAYIQAQQEMLIAANGEIFGTVTRVPQEWMTQAAASMNFPTAENFNLQDFRSQDVTKAQWPQIMERYNYILKQLQAQFPAFQPDLQWMGIILKDGFTTEHIDSTILQMAMQDLIDVTKEQGLQGMYNLPEGATFYIPITGYEMHMATARQMAEGGGGGTTAVTTFPVAEPQTLAEATQQHIDALARRNFFQGGDLAPNWRTQPSTTNPVPVTITNLPEVASALPPELQQVWTPEQGPLPPYMTLPPGTSGMQSTLQNPTGALPSVPSAEPTWLDNLKNFFDTLGASLLQTGLSPTPPIEQQPYPENPPTWLESLLVPFGPPSPEQMGATQAPISTALNLELDSTVQLVVDGRTLATIIKPFFYEDMIRFISSAPSTINRSIVA